MDKGEICAALDIGTNSTLFLLAEVDRHGVIRPILHDVRTNDLGRGIDRSGNLTRETIDLNINLLGAFNKKAEEYGAKCIRIAATEALRQAGNSEVLIRRAKEELGLDVRIISGEEEALLTYQGVISGIDIEDDTILAADVGGGSSEIILGRGDEILYSTSLKVGAVLLDSMFVRDNLPTDGQIEKMRAYSKEVLSELPASLLEGENRLVICGGTASSLAAADLGLSSYNPEKISGHVMTRSRLFEFIDQFQNCTLEQRRLIPGIGKRRAEIILPGTILITTFLDAIDRNHYYTSERGLRYGLLTP
ncbi:hypothetical protein CEE37_05435 [candidate division LCP-89 bacterium B3_LCP]|uniref:Ppx/GppA phosphatase N-terminal domain-containing protein n=1 Tax=candidate division LCP-89 bacterium B3_LCP TaxID=2012998 RepID=A0A532V1L6_UNCL8|nr:MAG: hypothetical protein CEE37_05435 [candidate division LCP-89 bacterium B3_LCP]